MLTLNARVTQAAMPQPASQQSRLTRAHHNHIAMNGPTAAQTAVLWEGGADRKVELG